MVNVYCVLLICLFNKQDIFYIICFSPQHFAAFFCSKYCPPILFLTCSYSTTHQGLTVPFLQYSCRPFSFLWKFLTFQASIRRMSFLSILITSFRVVPDRRSNWRLFYLQNVVCFFFFLFWRTPYSTCSALSQLSEIQDLTRFMVLSTRQLVTLPHLYLRIVSDVWFGYSVASSLRNKNLAETLKRYFMNASHYFCYLVLSCFCYHVLQKLA